MQIGTNACPICDYFICVLFCTACRTYVMWAFLFATCFAYTAWHYRQCVMAATLCATCFTCFTSWRCHFLSFFIFLPFILLQYLVFARKSLSVVGQVWVARHAPPACILINPTTVDVHHLRVQCVRPFLRPWQFHEHDGHMHRSQLVSNDQR